MRILIPILAVMMAVPVAARAQADPTDCAPDQPCESRGLPAAALNALEATQPAGRLTPAPPPGSDATIESMGQSEREQTEQSEALTAGAMDPHGRGDCQTDSTSSPDRIATAGLPALCGQAGR